MVYEFVLDMLVEDCSKIVTFVTFTTVCELFHIGEDDSVANFLFGSLLGCPEPLKCVLMEGIPVCDLG
jgi:hypothetical protein